MGNLALRGQGGKISRRGVSKFQLQSYGKETKGASGPKTWGSVQSSGWQSPWQGLVARKSVSNVGVSLNLTKDL